MEAGFIALAVVMTVLGIVFGMFVERSKIKQRKTQGILNIAYDEHDDPGLFLALSVPVEDIASKKLAIFSVNVLRQNSHE